MEYDELRNSIIDNLHKNYLRKDYPFPWIVGFSGGKDSTLMVQLLFDMLNERVPEGERNKPIYILSNDTLVENPVIITRIKDVLGKIDLINHDNRFNMKTVVMAPKIFSSFWCRVIGRGYPLPDVSYRWCTGDLKSHPMRTFITSIKKRNERGIILLGVRKAESTNRKKIIEANPNIEGTDYAFDRTSNNRHYIYRPIVDLTTEQVWRLLVNYDPIWGGTNRELAKIYSDAGEGECAIMVSEKETGSCNSKGTRFGCWTCTLSKHDRTMTGTSKAAEGKYDLLVDYRNWLYTLINNPYYRSEFRVNGKETKLDKKGNRMLGAFFMEAREEMLEKLLETQRLYGEQLISQTELDLIKEYWKTDKAKGIYSRNM